MTRQNPNEGDVKKDVKKLLDHYGWYWFMPPANTYGSNGIADFIALKAGHMLAIETKLKKKVGTANQEEFLKNVREHGGSALVVHAANLHELEVLLIQFDGLA